uniref:Calponin-homology (CH) domain-containing protein n=1 Tax=Macrostomum lignano TaxID=282301 RepID=A0A1I8HMB8_9PLAT
LRRTLTGRFATAATAAAASTAASTSASEVAISSPLSGRVVKRRSTGRAVRRAPRPMVAAAVAESPSSAVSDASDLSNLSMLAPTTPRSTAALASASMADQRSCSVFYDERWREKQEFGLQQWLNYLLTPGLALRCCQGEEQSASATAAAAAAAAAADTTGPAPTKEAVSLRAYADFRTLAALRSRGRRLMTSDSFVSVICRVEREVSEGRLRVRQDVCFRADRGLRARLVDFYLAFHPLWLRLALESLFDQPILTSAAATPSDGSDAGGAAARRTPLRAFILNRVLWSPGLADRFAMPGVCNLYRKGFDAELSKYVLNKFLAIVYFLDRAKTDRLIDFDPCLFTKRSQHKSTKEVVTAFTRDYLSGEGDVIKHLGYMGYRLSHAQKPLDEYQFGVTNLAVDLRDGIRLCRTLDILTGGRTALSGQVRCPAISRLQKIRNCQAAFEALKGLGVSLDWTPGNPIDPRDIVDGHREKTLSLLWRCLARFSLAEDPGLVGRLLCEIRALRRALRTRGAACPPAPADPSPASLLPCWAACVAAFDWPAGRPPPAEDDSRVVMRLLRHYGAAPPAADDNNDGADSWRAVAERLAELGQCPALIMPNSSDRPDRCMLLAQLAALAGSLLNLNAESRAARVIQAAWRRRCASLAGPPAAQEDRVDALPAKVSAESAVFEFNIGVWPGTPGPASKPADTPSRCLLDVQAIRRAQAASAIQRWFRRARQIRIGRIRREIERRRRRRAILVIVTNYQISRRNRFFALLQDHVTRWLANRQAAGRRIQQFWRAYRIKRIELERLRAERLERETLAACQIQRAAFRGWRVRARCQVAAMPQLRRRISAAYADARRNPERLLLARARSALRFARQQLPAPAVAQQLADLRAGTSHSAKLCELLCSQSGAVAALFSLMAGCNRSLPHQHIVLHSVQILHNLIRHSATAASVARECPVKAGDVLTDALVSGAVVRPSPLQQELVKASACLLASLVSSAAGVSGGFALSRRAVVRLRETRDALLRRAGLEERRLVSQLKASGALLVRVEPDWVLKRSANQHMASPITAVCYLCELLR